MMIVYLFMALLSVQQPVQQPRVPFEIPRDAILPASVRQSVEGGFPLEGQITWEAGAEPALVDVELRGSDESTVIGRMQATTNGLFRFNNVRYGTYWIVIESERYNYIRQRVIVDNSTFAMIQVAVSLFPRTVAEGGDPVAAVQALRVKIPKKAFEKYEDALEEFQKGKEDKGIDRLEEALEMAPDYYDAHLDLGFAHQRAGDAEQAIVSLKKAVEINPSAADGLSWLGRLYYETGQFPAAVGALSGRIELGAASADDSFYIGSAYYKMGAYAKAEESLLRSVSIAPETSGPARLQLVNVYMRSRRPFLALEQLETYLAEHPDDTNLEAYQKRVDDLKQMLNQGPPPR
jgi:Tfp pilus assembly protein PilF